MWFGKCHWFACMHACVCTSARIRVCVFVRQISKISIAPKLCRHIYLISSFNLSVFDLTSNRFHIISLPSIWFDLLSSQKKNSNSNTRISSKYAKLIKISWTDKPQATQCVFTDANAKCFSQLQSNRITKINFIIKVKPIFFSKMCHARKKEAFSKRRLSNYVLNKDLLFSHAVCCSKISHDSNWLRF